MTNMVAGKEDGMSSVQWADDDNDAHKLDEGRLDAYLRAHLDGYRGELTVRRLKGGASNPTYVLSETDGAITRRYVLRKKPPGILLPSAHQVEREYKIMKALGPTDVPVPNARLLCEDSDVAGTPFYIMDFMEGRIFRDPTLPGMTPAERTKVYDSFVDVMARLHQVDFVGAGLGDLGKPGNFFERQTARWIKQYRGAQTDEIPEMEELIAALPAMIPQDNSVTIAHGDFRPENMMFHPTEPRVIALLDWELCTLGHPLADLGYACIMYHAKIDRWGTLHDVDFATSGIPDEQALVDNYCRRTGRDGVENLSFYTAFALFRLASISQGVYKRGLDGIGTGYDSANLNGAPDIARFGVALLDRG